MQTPPGRWGRHVADDSRNEMADHYTQVAKGVLEHLDDDAVCGRSSCCEPSSTASEVELYAQDIAESLPEGARAASRGCGDPVSMASLSPGEVVCDLGSGGGIDALIAARLVGPAGHVYGIDMTDEMVRLAQRNADDAGSANVEFLRGRIEDVPLPDGSVDVVISNCVINLSDSKQAVLSEACRILRPDGRLVVSDIVVFDPDAPSLDPPSWDALCRIVGCVRGMADASSYGDMLRAAGFTQVAIEPKTVYTLDVLHEKALRKDRQALFEEIANCPEADGLCGSAIITARKADP